MNTIRQISGKEKDRIFKRDKGSCRYCGNKEGPFEFDHVYPYVKGGETSIRNIVLSCSKCNRRKHDAVGIWPYPVGYFDNKIDAEWYKQIIDCIILVVTEVLMTLGLATAFILRYLPHENMVYVVSIEIILAAIFITPLVLKRLYADFKIIKDEFQNIWKITKETFNEKS